MSNIPKDEIQTPSEMLANAKERSLNSRIYNKTADHGAIVYTVNTTMKNIIKKSQENQSQGSFF